MHGLLEQRVLGEERDLQAGLEFEVGAREWRKLLKLRFGFRFGWEGAGFAGGDADGVGFGFVDQRVEFGDFDGVAALFAAAEPEDVGVVGRAATVEKEGVLPEDGVAQGRLSGVFVIPAGGLGLPAKLQGETGGKGAVAAGVQVHAVVGALGKVDPRGALPFALDEGRLLFGREFAQDLLVGGEQGVVFSRVGQAWAAAA